jgi:hypothetical protein
VIHANLRPGGRFVGFNDNPANPPASYGSYRAYGFLKSTTAKREEGDPIVYTLFNPDGASFGITNYYLAPETYAAAFRDAGFDSFAWCGPWLSEEGERSFPAGFWDAFREDPPLIGMQAVR